MAFDPDNVRVDLLKIKRKLYMSYPEGSKERLDFLVASKVSELSYLTKLVDTDSIQEVFKEYKYRLKSEILASICSLLVGACLTVMLLGFHQLHPTNFLLSLYPLPFIFGLGYSIVHMTHLFTHWKEFKPFKKDYDILKKRMEKIIDEIKELTK